ncbi:MAG: hypothetical protein E7485_08520 [Ruminococcaceae bacterium]|nr:hypothetical protein [Oscillospiraceae bacterium]
MEATIIVALISGTVSIFTVVFSAVMAHIGTKQTKERKKELDKFAEWDNLRQNVAKGTQCLLRAEIIRSHEKYIDRGYCPVYAKESLTRAYQAYHKLGGNDVATALYEQLMSLPNDERRNENE